MLRGIFKRNTKRPRELEVEAMDQTGSIKIHLVKMVHFKPLRDIYRLDRKTLKISQVLSDIDLSVGDQVVAFNGVELRGKTHDAYFDLKRNLPTGDKITLLVARKSSDPQCLDPKFKLPESHLQTQIFCCKCGKTIYVSNFVEYGQGIVHLMTCDGIQVESCTSQPLEVEDDVEIVVKASPKRLQASLFAPTSKTKITFGNMMWRWNEFCQANPTRKKVVTPHFIQEVLAQTGLPIVEFNKDLEPPKYKRYTAVIDTLRKRFKRRLDKIESTHGAAKIDNDEVMFDLEKEQILIDMNCYDPPDVPDSQGSDFSISSSQMSEIEQEVPMPEPEPEEAEAEPEPEPEPTPSTSKPRKRLDECVDTTIRDKMTNLFNFNVEYCETNGINVTEAFATMGHRYNYVHDRKLAGTFKEIMKGNFILPLEMPMDEAIHVKSQFIPTQRKWTDFKALFKKYVTVPGYDKLSQHIHKIVPQKTPIRNGYRLPLRTVAKETLQRLPEKVSQIYYFHCIPNTNLFYYFQLKQELYGESNGRPLTAKITYGFDGCGSYSPYYGPTYYGSAISNGNLIFGGLALTTIVHKDESGSERVVYKVPKMASSRNQRPILLVDGKEEDDMLNEIFSHFEEEHPEAEKQPVVIKLDDGTELTVKLELKCSAMDGKLIRMAQGRIGAFCVMCSRTREQAHKPDVIEAGMNVDLSTAEINATYEKFKQKDPLEYKILTRNYSVEIRKGQTQKPKVVNIEVATILPPLHAKLRCETWAVDMMVRFCSGKTIYRQKDDEKSADYVKVQNTFRANSNRICGFPFLKIDGDTGTTADLFFAYENREKVLKILDLYTPARPVSATRNQMEPYNKRMAEIEHFKNTWRKVLQKINVITKIINGDYLVNVEAFDQFCTQTALMIRRELDWVWFSPTVHQVLAHAAEAIKDNECRGLLNQSEEGSEASHKKIKHLRLKAARQISLNANLEDVFNTLWIDSDFQVRSYDRTPTCSHCKEDGHWTRSCPKKHAKNKPKTPDDLIIESLTYDDGDTEDKN